MSKATWRFTTYNGVPIRLSSRQLPDHPIDRLFTFSILRTCASLRQCAQFLVHTVSTPLVTPNSYYCTRLAQALLNPPHSFTSPPRLPRHPALLGCHRPIDTPQVHALFWPACSQTDTHRTESELLLASSLRGFQLLAMHVLARSSQSFATPQLVPAPNWDLQHASPPRTRTAAGPHDDALRSATTGRVGIPCYLFTTLTPIRTFPSCVHLERAGVGDGGGDRDGEVHEMVDWDMEVENEMKMEMGTAHSWISVEMLTPSEIG
ncbi:hypothetical protein B0H13DRAFT_2366142 [Mycena leptocephala]|nr:hypothetical protein B0H13DRAFT_2366142 [Mycena leptocephala]